jgi:hypothetical protein
MIYAPKLRPGGRKVYCAWFRHHRTGKIIYPKRGKCFCFWVK